MSMRANILDEAKLIVTTDRDAEYGTPEDNFQRIANLWTAYTGVAFEPHDVATMMLLVKVARISTSPHKEDHWVDIAGYAACGGEVKPGRE